MFNADRFKGQADVASTGSNETIGIQVIENSEDAFVVESELMINKMEAQLEKDIWASKRLPSADSKK